MLEFFKEDGLALALWYGWCLSNILRLDRRRRFVEAFLGWRLDVWERGEPSPDDQYRIKGIYLHCVLEVLPSLGSRSFRTSDLEVQSPHQSNLPIEVNTSVTHIIVHLKLTF